MTSAMPGWNECSRCCGIGRGSLAVTPLRGRPSVATSNLEGLFDGIRISLCLRGPARDAANQLIPAATRIP